MTRHLSSEQARAHWRETLDAVAAGERIVIERYGRPVAVLAPYAESPAGQLREPGPAYDTDTLKQLKAEIVADVLAELEAGQLEPISWREGWADLQASVAAHGGLNVGESTEEIVAHMRRIREEIFEAEYAHLYR